MSQVNRTTATINAARTYRWEADHYTAGSARRAKRTAKRDARRASRRLARAIVRGAE